MNAEQAMVLADEESPVFLAAVGDLMSAMVIDEPRIADAFTSGKGVGWNERSECLFCGTARFFRSTYKHHLVQEWLPALDGVVANLERGANVADVGCGHGISTMLMAKAYPNHSFTVLTHIRDRSTPRARWPRPKVPLTPRSQSRPRRRFPRTPMISSASSIVCTTWAIRSAH
jgi:hypothetical protein